METVKLNVEGMSCSHCEKAVKNAVGALSGVKSVAVSLKDKTVTVEHDPNKATLEQIRHEIEEQGYEVK
jgi:copper chaperone